MIKSYGHMSSDKIERRKLYTRRVQDVGVFYLLRYRFAYEGD
jgi:hypothetical protein